LVQEKNVSVSIYMLTSPLYTVTFGIIGYQMCTLSSVRLLREVVR